MRSAAPYSSTGSAKSATVPMKTSATARAVGTCSSRPSFYGIRPTCSAPSITYANRGTIRHPGDLAHLSPLGWEHINLTGDYHWDTSPTLGPDQFRPLRTGAYDFAAAA